MSQRPGRDDGSPPPGDGDLPELPPEWRNLVVPDDPAELAAEAEQVRAELLMKAAWPDKSAPPDPPRSVLPLAVPLGVLAMLMVAALVGLVVLVMPAAPRPPRPAPLGTPSAAPGTPGGLLPDVVLVDSDGRPVRVRDLRPAVLLLAPASCPRCAAVTGEVVEASRDAGILVVLVTTGDRPSALPWSADGVRTRTLGDPRGALSAGVPDRSSSGPTAVLVRPDGQIARVVYELADAGQLRGDFASLTID